MISPSNLRSLIALLSLACTANGPVWAQRAAVSSPATAPAIQTHALPTSKQLASVVPGAPTRTNSLPMTVAVSPDRRYLALLNAGYGTFESRYEQSIAIYDTATGKLSDFPEPRTASGAPQTLFQGLAFSSDGGHLYASFESLTAPEGRKPEGGKDNQTGNAVAVYSFAGGVVRSERVIPVPLQQLAAGKMQNQLGSPLPAGQANPGLANPGPAGLAVVKDPAGQDALLVADNLSDDVLLLDAATGKMITRFDLSAGNVVPSTYPIVVTANREGTRAYAALWNGSAIAELDLKGGRVAGRLPLMPPDGITSPSSHPTAFAWAPDGNTVYVALANRDAVAAVGVRGGGMKLLGSFNTRLPGQNRFGAEPDAIAVSDDGTRLYAANAGTDAVAVFHTRELRVGAKPARPVAASGFIPTEWLPTGAAVVGGKLYIATGKGQGTGPNGMPQRVVAGDKRSRRPYTYIGTMLYGSLAAIDLAPAEAGLSALTRQAVESNMQTAAQQHIVFARGAHPIRHVIYIIKENRTYDQIFGDLGAGNGDPSLTMYGRKITPNQHKLAEQFGVLDNFYDSGEVSGDGHVWSTAAISSDYTEKTWQQSYRGKERMYDYEGVAENGFPLEEKIPDVNEPESSYLWTNLARHGKSLYHFGEFISTRFCGEERPLPRRSPLEGTPEPETLHCAHPSILPNEAIPANYGGGTSKYPWAIPLIAQNIATKPELAGHFDPHYPDFELAFPDQLRFEEFMVHFREWVAAKKNGGDPMPAFVMLRFPNDHTAGTKPGMPRPEASVADNDLAVGRAVEAISHSPYWEDTAFFILEDDAQNGADHVDAHRSTALVISKYAPRAPEPVVDHHFYTTVSMIRTMEDLLGVSPMNNNDAFAPPMAALFAGAGDQPAFNADFSNRDSGMIYEMNTAKAPGAKESSRMDFRHEDRADPQKLNAILWRDAMGSAPMPNALRVVSAKRKED